MTGLVVEQATVSYGDAFAIQNFDLEVSPGEILAVLGPSGSGKSTLLRAVAGLEPLVSGRILLGGRDLQGVPTHRRGLGMMFQDHGLFAHLDVADNIGYGLKVAGVARAARRSRVSELLNLVGLQGFDNRGTGQLSGGEAQRVALARALAPEPALLMLDEPLGSLDRALRDQLTGDLRRMLTELGQTALHVTHDQSEAFAIADRIAVVSEGRPVAVGAPSDLWADPGTVFVARFLGHSNVWKVTVDDERNLFAGSLLLGKVQAEHPLLNTEHGRGQDRFVVVPITAIRPGSIQPSGGQSISAEVGASVFRQGFYEVTATVTSAQQSWNEPIVFVTPEPVSPGESISLIVDCEAVRPLVDE